MIYKISPQCCKTVCCILAVIYQCDPLGLAVYSGFGKGLDPTPIVAFGVSPYLVKLSETPPIGRSPTIGCKPEVSSHVDRALTSPASARCLPAWVAVAGAAWPAPASYALTGYDHPTLRQNQLDVPQAVSVIGGERGASSRPTEIGRRVTSCSANMI